MKRKNRRNLLRFLGEILLVTLLMVMMVGCSEQQMAVPEATTPTASEEEPEMVLEEEVPAYQKITADEAWELMQEEEVIIVDVRTPEEFASGYIEDALLLPVDDIPSRAAEVLPDTTATILLYCRSGRRSALAGHALVEMGYTRILDFGGIQDWPYETVRE